MMRFRVYPLQRGGSIGPNAIATRGEGRSAASGLDRTGGA
jgi:hypothetical protein